MKSYVIVQLVHDNGSFLISNYVYCVCKYLWSHVCIRGDIKIIIAVLPRDPAWNAFAHSCKLRALKICSKREAAASRSASARY